MTSSSTAARIVPHNVLIYLATKDRRRQENVVTKRDCPRFPYSFLDRIYKIYRILGELEKIVGVGLPANLSAKACAAAEALAKAGEWNG